MIQFLRFPVKLTFAVLLAMLLGFYFNLETPRWAVMTAGIVAGGQAFAAGGDPYSGALRYRGLLRIIGTLLGCVAALAIVMTTIRAPMIMLFLSCLWAGFCVWVSSLVKVDNSYAFGLAGYTALIIIISANASGSMELMPRLAVERCSEIFIGIICVILSDIFFSPRSIKKVIDQEVDHLLLAQYQLLQFCVGQKDKEEVDKAWSSLVARSSAFSGMRSQLKMESSHWQNSSRRLKMLNTLSLTMITHATETYLNLQAHPEYLSSAFVELIEQKVASIADLRIKVRELRKLIHEYPKESVPLALSTWVSAASEYLLLSKGIRSNVKVNGTEEAILRREDIVAPRSAETHHAMINGIRTFVATFSGVLFWLYSGWNAGSGCMIMLAVVTALAMRIPNPLMMAKDFLYGMTAAFPVGLLYYAYLMPSTQQSIFLLCLIIGLLAFVAGALIQRRQVGALGGFIGTLNVIVLSNPITFPIESFLDNSLGQMIGCFLSLMVILLIRDKSKAKTGRKILNRFMYAAVSSLTTNPSRRRENHLPALYQQLFLLLNMFPGDLNKYRLALTLIISQQRLRGFSIPPSPELSAFHQRLRGTGDKVIAARSVEKKEFYYTQLIQELEKYEQLLEEYDVSVTVKESVHRLTDILTRYQSTMINI
ncbi:p-hydroxybenzoic acid efflux pump subunit AaeB [Rosenbergiella australiborealis]|uniref:p-hydroxybenzoic acid efflux pump subunit AaeB n=1 Tax=Rosenbergiella australiborealis TaxID=1544696 RepID=A0ABS5T0E0_9GAMM|nr:p-hydroxybenzoic acid efflux pump subunit AaeB [Rosenbergiella australiborealis]MBT0725814.1 p-hydroxybenzoic acid efflux pump subunit AaeB [Rosenbergiella australiborealis]